MTKFTINPSGGTTTEITDGSITYAKIQNVSATDKLLGRVSSGAGSVEEIACTAAGRALLDDATAGDQLTTLGAAAAAHNHAGSAITSGTVAATYLPSFGTSAAGIVPASGGGTTNYLRADATWAAPAGAGGDVTFDTIAALRAGGVGSAGDVVDVKGYYAIGDGGGGLFDWVASSSAADDGGTIINPTGNEGNGRWLRRISGMANVLWWGAKNSNSSADASTNQTAIQAAIDSGKAIFFPAGNYYVAGPLKFAASSPTKLIGERFPGLTGDSAAHLIDNRSGSEEEPFLRNPYGWKKYDGTFVNNGGTPVSSQEDIGWQASVYMEDLAISCGERAKGTAVQIIRAQGNSFRNLNIYARRCLELNYGVFDSTVINCTFRGGGFEVAYDWGDGINRNEFLRNYGMCTQGHTYIFGCTAVGCGVGFRLHGAATLIGARAENNYMAYAFGYNREVPEGLEPYAYAGASAQGLSGEANVIGVSIQSMRRSSISDVSIQGSWPQGDMTWYPYVGIELFNAEPDSKVERVFCGGYFLHSAIINESNVPIDFAMAGNNHSTGAIVGGSKAMFSKFTGIEPAFQATKMLLFPGATYERHKTITTCHDLMLPGLTGINLYKTAASGTAAGGAVFSKNLGGTITPANGASTAAVTFTGEVSSGTVAFGEVTPQAGGSLTANQTYYYAMTVTAANGEIGPDLGNTDSVMQKSATTTTTNKQMYITFYQTNVPSQRRLYRSTTPGVFSGYWNVSGGNFTDTGAIAFDGYSPPQNLGNIPTRNEDDANYQIVATASWGTTVWVTNKATTGFTLNFGTAAPDGNQTVSWLLFRP